MKHTGKITVGIDVTETQVNMVMLRRTATGCIVVDSAAAPVPEHAIEHGRVVDARLLAKAFKAVRRRGRMPAGSISISLPVQGTLTRIMPLTEQDPQRIAQFVRDELKQYAVLSGHETVFDFRVLTPNRQDARGSVLVTATDHENVTRLAAAGGLAGMQIAAIEPAVTACVRLLSADKTAVPAETGLMIALLKESALTVCVCRRGVLDFTRTETLETMGQDPEAAGPRIAEELAAVMRFYSLRNNDPVQDWKVVLADDAPSPVLSRTLPLLQTRAGVGAISLVTPDNLPHELTIDLQGRTGISLTALALALRMLATKEDGSSVNLLPREVSVARGAKRNMFVMANALAIVMLTLILGTGAVAYMGKRINQKIVALKQTALQRGDRSLPVARVEMTYIDEQTKKLSAEVQYMEAIGDSHPSVDWVQFLDDVRKAALAHRMRLTELVMDGGDEATIQGVSTSAEDLRAFAERLSASSQIRQASVVRKERNWKEGERIEYEIQCLLSEGKAS
jgi:Tfp pilus assembly protein PilN